MVGGARAQFEIWEETCREDNNDNFRQLLGNFRITRRTGGWKPIIQINKDDPMDVNAVGDSWSDGNENLDEWYSETGGHANLDALGKSKDKGNQGKGNGKGKPMGIQGHCYKRGEI